jgi:hypothetical protein
LRSFEKFAAVTGPVVTREMTDGVVGTGVVVPFTAAPFTKVCPPGTKLLAQLGCHMEP